MNRYSTAIRGFTLIELAVVLFIVGLLLAGLLTPLAARIEQEERRRTQSALEEIREALYGFAVIRGRLPCPDTDGDGEENLSAGSCESAVGELPWRTLAVDRFDAWGRRFLYRVTESFANEPPTGSMTTITLVMNGDIQIKGQGGTALASDVPAVVVSFGKHRYLPSDASADELENFERFPLNFCDPCGAGDDRPSDNTPTDFLARFVSRDYARDFDDLVVWISPNILKNRMVMAGRLP